MSMLGIVFTNIADRVIPELTRNRTLASVPFGGRYRLIDFVLANMVNSDITRIGVITKSHYQSLMEHLGSGKDWDLSRKSGGLIVLPPFGGDHNQMLYSNRLEALKGIFGFLDESTEDYVVMSDSDIVCNLSITDMLHAHERSRADITVAYREVHFDEPSEADSVMLKMDETGRVNSLGVFKGVRGHQLVGMNIWLMKRTYLQSIVADAIAHGQSSFSREVLAPHLDSIKLMAHRYEGYYACIASLQSYFKIHMELLEQKNRHALFDVPGRPVYTRVRDSAPTTYGMEADVKNALIADGCIIEGTVENSVLFRGVKVSRGAVVRNSIVMQNCIIGDGAQLNYIITDRNVAVRDRTQLSGSEIYPFFVAQNTVV